METVNISGTSKRNDSGIIRNAKGQIQKGSVGIGGRQTGSRNKLGEAFINHLYADYLKHGPQVIAEVRAQHPAAYLRMIVQLLPQQAEVDVSVHRPQFAMFPADLTPDQIQALTPESKLIDLKPEDPDNG